MRTKARWQVSCGMGSDAVYKFSRLFALMRPLWVQISELQAQLEDLAARREALRAELTNGSSTSAQVGPQRIGSNSWGVASLYVPERTPLWVQTVPYHSAPLGLHAPGALPHSSFS